MNLRFLLLITLAGCRDDACPVEADIAPGCGILLDGQPLRLGDALADLAQSFGEPTRLDLGASGERFDLAGVAGFSDDADAVRSLALGEGFVGATAEGLGLGSSATEVEEAFGVATPEPLTGGWWYGSLGIGFEIDGEGEGEAVDRIHVFPAQPGW